MAALNPCPNPTLFLLHRHPSLRTRSLDVAALARKGGPLTLVRPLLKHCRRHCEITCHAAAKGDAYARQGDDGASLDDSPNTSEIGTSSPNSGVSRPVDGYVGLFVRMLGLDNDPLDREQAVTTLWKYSLGGKECVDDIMKFPGCINLVVSLLRSESTSAREAAAGLLRTISSVNVYREFVVKSGAIEEIAGALRQVSSAPEVIEQCLYTLWNLSVDEGPRVKIANSDLLFGLVKFIDDEDMKVKEAAGRVLATLALTHCNHNLMVQAGVIPKLAEQLKCSVEGDKVLRKEAKCALMELSKDEFNKILIIEEGLIFVPMIGTSAYKSFRSVSRSWPSLPDGTEIQRNPSPSRYGASELLLGLNFCEKSELEEAKMKAVVGRSRQQFLARIGAIELDNEGNLPLGPATEQQTLLPLVDGVARLVLILELEDMSAIFRATCAISDALISEEIRLYFKEAGVVPRLIQLLDHCNEGVIEAAILALEKLSVSSKVCQMFESENLLNPLIKFIKSKRTSKHLKEKILIILARIFNPDKIMEAEFNNKLINGSGNVVTPDISCFSQPIMGETIIDSDAISFFLEIMMTSTPNIQRKIVSILEYLASSDSYLSALTDAGVDSALLAVLQGIPIAGPEEDYGQDLDAVNIGETGVVIAAASRLLTKLLDFEKFRHRMNHLSFVNVLRKILKSSSIIQGKDWVAACLVKIDVMVGCGTASKDTINVEVTRYEVIPRLVGQMKASSLESNEAAVVELNKIRSEGMVDCSRAIAASGGIFPLVNVIDKVNDAALEAGLAVLYNLSMDAENHAAIIAAGAVPVLRRIVLSGGPQWTRALHLLRVIPT